MDLFEVKDPHTVSGLLKLYIRQLPDPLGTFEYYSDWLRASQGMLKQMQEAAREVEADRHCLLRQPAQLLISPQCREMRCRHS